MTPNVSTLVTEVALGTTFTSGTAYISYSGASAGGPGGTCGQVHSSGIFAVPSSRVSSYFYRAPGPTVTDEAEFASLASFNFADLAPNPLPAAAWSAQASCVDNLGETPVDCATITEANYAPEIVSNLNLILMKTAIAKYSIECATIVQEPGSSLVKLPISWGSGRSTLRTQSGTICRCSSSESNDSFNGELFGPNSTCYTWKRTSTCIPFTDRFTTNCG